MPSSLTDPDSRLVHGMRGRVKGYNAQAVCNEQHLIVAAEVMTASPDFGHLDPMSAAARRVLAAAGAPNFLSWPMPMLIPPDFSRRTNKPTRLGWNGGGYDFMRSVLATERGTDLHKQRAQLIEPIFGSTKHNRGFTRFHRPGRSAVRPEWRLMATTHNLTRK
jgi:hypothetical protein